MYINEFCGSWMEHPFWKAKFLLEGDKDLQRIRDSGIDEVWIDVSKGLDLPAGRSAQSSTWMAVPMTTSSRLNQRPAAGRASEAVPQVANTAHALHGAIGVTEEYDLQLYTRRLHEWRMAHGSEAHWNVLIGQRVLAADVSIVDFVRSV